MEPTLTTVPVTDAEKIARKQIELRRRAALTASVQKAADVRRKKYEANKALAKKLGHEHMNSLNRTAYGRWKMRAFMHLGGRCEICEINDMSVLELDHRNGGGRDERRRMSISKMFKRVLTHPTEYQLLCANCHARKHATKKEF